MAKNLKESCDIAEKDVKSKWAAKASTVDGIKNFDNDDQATKQPKIEETAKNLNWIPQSRYVFKVYRLILDCIPYYILPHAMHATVWWHG